MKTLDIFVMRMNDIAGDSVFLNKKQVAKLFGIGQTTLDRKMTGLKRMKLTDGMKNVVFSREDLIDFVQKKMGEAQ